MRRKKPIVIITFVILVIAAGFIHYLGRNKLPPAITLDTSGQPTIGYPKAKVHVVVFEEPKCSNCRDYTLQVYPTIKRDFIDTNKITYTVIPVSFLPGSMPAAVALLCVYKANPDYPNNEMFFKYLDYLFSHQPDEHTDWATPEKLGDFARQTSPAIKIDELKKCVEMETYRIQIDKNTAYGQTVMKGALSTPTVYVNGIEAKEISTEGISKLIKQCLEKEGVY